MHIKQVYKLWKKRTTSIYGMLKTDSYATYL